MSQYLEELAVSFGLYFLENLDLRKGNLRSIRRKLVA